MTADAWFRDDVAHEREGDGGDGGLATRSVRSGATAVGARAAQLVVQLGAMMLLARILTPADFGVQAMVLPLAYLLNGITNQALQSAVMQQDALEPADASGLFYAALPINASLTSAMALLGLLLAWLYDEPRVVLVAVAWAGVIFMVTLSSIHEALLKRRLRFVTLARAQLVTHASSFAVAIIAALAGAGYWALMLQVALMELGRAASMWVLVPWRPVAARHGERTKAAREYWLGLMGARAISWIGDQSDRVMVGVSGGASIAGLYDSAKRWAWFSFFELFIPLTDVAVATLSRVRQDTERFRAYVRQAFMSVLAVTLPVAGFMFAEARLVLHVILGPQWLGGAVFVRWLCVAIVGATLIRLMQWVYLSTGRTMRQLRWSLVTTPVIVLAVCVGGLRYGAVGVAAGLTVAAVTLAVPSVWNAIRDTPLTLRDCLGVVTRPLTAAAFGAVVLLLIGPRLPSPNPVLALGVRLPVFGMAYLAGWLVLPGGRRMLAEQLARLREVVATWQTALGRLKN
ncbi:MAG: oligosaccharide flippase family protein [Gemmatimonadaceae bacterium]